MESNELRVYFNAIINELRGINEILRQEYEHIEEDIDDDLKEVENGKQKGTRIKEIR